MAFMQKSGFLATIFQPETLDGLSKEIASHQ